MKSNGAEKHFAGTNGSDGYNSFKKKNLVEEFKNKAEKRKLFDNLTNNTIFTSMLLAFKYF